MLMLGLLSTRRGLADVRRIFSSGDKMGSISELFAEEQKAETEKEDDTKPTPARQTMPLKSTPPTRARRRMNPWNWGGEEEVKEVKASYHRLAARLVAQKRAMVVDQATKARWHRR